MHTNNKKWLDDLKKQYPHNFDGARVLELGSGSIDLAGTIRPWFNQAIEYFGIDREAGEGVDWVGNVVDFEHEENYFDTIACFSMLEHDLEWRKSMSNAIRFLKPEGMMFMCWGAEGNGKHMDIWKLVPHQEVLDFLNENGFEIIDNFFEEDRYGKDCPGAYDVIAKKLPQ